MLPVPRISNLKKGLLLGVGLLILVTQASAFMAFPMFPGIPPTGIQDKVLKSVCDLPKRDPNSQLRADFIASVVNGNSDQVVGVYVPGAFSLPIVQQPASNPGYVSSKLGVGTQFAMAAKYGAIGILAHNTLSGESFFRLQPGQFVMIIYGDGTMKQYQISTILQYQALSPNSPYSDFLDIADGGRRYSASDLFYELYAGGDSVVFQTCIAQNGISTWGRHFVIGIPAANVLRLTRATAVVH